MEKENPIKTWNRTTVKRDKLYRWNDLIRYADFDVDEERFIVAFKKEKNIEYCIHCIIPRQYSDENAVWKNNSEENPMVRINEIYKRKLRKEE